MAPTSADTRIRDCVQRFAADLTLIVKRSALHAVRGALGDATTVGEAPKRSPANASSRSAPASTARGAGARFADEAQVPIRLEAYERNAILRALAENGGNAIAAGEALGLTRSAIYRRMVATGIPRSGGGVDVAEVAPEGYLRLDGPLRLETYERRAIERAIEAAGGDKREAARALGIGNSTIHRRIRFLGMK